VYARSGTRVFQQQNFDLQEGIGWDGTFNREILNADVFIYFAEVEFIDGGKEMFKGDFT